LKTKATKAYKFGEGLVKSITANERTNPNSHEVSPETTPPGAPKQRQVAYSMQFKDFVSLKDYYD